MLVPALYYMVSGAGIQTTVSAADHIDEPGVHKFGLLANYTRFESSEYNQPSPVVTEEICFYTATIIRKI